MERRRSRAALTPQNVNPASTRRRPPRCRDRPPKNLRVVALIKFGPPVRASTSCLANYGFKIDYRFIAADLKGRSFPRQRRPCVRSPRTTYQQHRDGKLCSASPKWLAGVDIETVVSHLVSLRLLSIASELHPI